MRRPLLYVGLFSVACAVSAIAHAEPSLRVRGGATVEASATAFDAQIEVKGVVRDDTGRPIGHSNVQLRLLEREGGAYLPLPSAAACSPSPSLRETRGLPGQPDEYTIDTDEAGGFCARVPGEIAGLFELVFQEAEGFYDPARRLVAVDRSRLGIELGFVAPPTALPLEAERHQLALEVRMRPLPEIRPELPIEVTIPSRSFRTHVVARAGETTPITIPKGELGAPGPLEIVARYPGTARYQPAEARVRASATARVTLSLASTPTPGRADEGIPLRVAVGSQVGAVPSGSVEARLGNETVGIARVSRGLAELTVRFDARARSVPLSLYYLAAEPWWLASEPLAVTVQPLPPSKWGRWVWLVALVLVGTWVVAGWWRPRPLPRASKPSTPERALPQPALRVLESGSPDAGWTGRVIDVHDGAPIPDATVTLVRRSFEGEHTLETCVTGPEGEFTLAPLGDHGGVWLVARARWHSYLERTLPPAGRLSVELVTRRRRVLARLVAWADRRGKPWISAGEPTPGHVAQIARKERKAEISEWARAVEAAAFGPEPVDESAERSVVEREPDREPGERDAGRERDH